MKEKPISELLEFSIINLDKPVGPTSFGVDVIIKKLLGAKKTSHFGTLDPKVSGVLPIALDRACRLSDYFMHKNKEYAGIMRVHKEISIEDMEKTIRKGFLGKIKQVPPVKSRVKREEREREVFSFKILEQNEMDFLFEAEVEAGTYIRKLISDLGEGIGGAHMLELRRVKAGIFSESDKEFVGLYELEKAVEEWKQGDNKKLKEILIPADEAVKKIMPVVMVKLNKEILKKLLHGSPIMRDFLKEEIMNERFALFNNEIFIGIYRKTNEKGISARPEFVFN